MLVKSDAGQGEGLGGGAQVAVGRAHAHASGGTGREGIGQPVELGSRSGEGYDADLDVGQEAPGGYQPGVAQGLLAS